MSTRKLATFGFALGLLLLGACKDKDSSAPTSQGEHETPVICTRCQARHTLYLASEAKGESWPKQCPSCKRWTLYACENCKQCGAPVPLMDARTRGFGYPPLCPKCGQPWQP